MCIIIGNRACINRIGFTVLINNPGCIVRNGGLFLTNLRGGGASNDRISNLFVLATSPLRMFDLQFVL